MTRIYKFNIFSRSIFLLVLLIGIYGAYELGKLYGFVVTLILIIIIIWFVQLVFRFRIVVTEDYLVNDLGRLGKRIEYNWSQIDRVSRIPLGFLPMYMIHCKNRPNLMFPIFVANYKDLLSEIVNRSQYATVDDSVRKFLEKNNNK